MNSFLKAFLFMGLVALSSAVGTANLSATVNSTTGNVKFTVSCSNVSNLTYVVAWIERNQKSVNTALLNATVNSTNPVNISDGSIYLYSAAVNSTTFQGELPVTNFQNLGLPYSAVAYCVNNSTENLNFSSQASTFWTQPYNNGRNLKISVTYNTTFNDSTAGEYQNVTFTKAQAQAVWKAIPSLNYLDVTNFQGDTATGPTARRLLAGNVTTTTAVTYVLQDPYVFNGSVALAAVQEAFKNLTTLKDDISTNISKILNVSNIPVLNVTLEILPVSTPSLSESTITDSKITVSISTTGAGKYFIAGIKNLTTNLETLSRANVATNSFDSKPFDYYQTGNTSTAGNVSVAFDGISANTTVRFFSVFRPDRPIMLDSNISFANFTTLPASNGSNGSNTSNTSTYSAVITTSINNESFVTVTVNCSLDSLTVLMAADLDNHQTSYTPQQILTNLGSDDFFSNLGINIGGRVKANNTLFSFTIDPKYLRNIGQNYSAIAYCQNATNYSTAGYAKWVQPDNGGKTFQLTATYNGSFNPNTSALNQAKAFASLLPNVSSSLIVTSNGTSAASSNSSTLLLARLLQSTSTLIPTYVLSNYSLAKDNTSVSVNSLTANLTQTKAALQNYYSNHSINISVLSIEVATLANPAVTLSLEGNATSSSVTFKVGGNVAGSYSLCAANSSFDTYNLNPSDVASCVDEKVYPLTKSKQGDVGQNSTSTVTITGLSANTTYQFLAVLKTTVPSTTYSNIVRVVGTTAKGSGTYGEKMVFGSVVTLLLLALGFLLN